MTFGDLTVSSSDATFYGTNSLINRELQHANQLSQS